MSGVVVVGTLPSVAPAAQVAPLTPSSHSRGTPRGLWLGLGAVVAVAVLATVRVVRPRRPAEATA
jgi:hypothetical protein